MHISLVIIQCPRFPVDLTKRQLHFEPLFTLSNSKATAVTLIYVDYTIISGVSRTDQHGRERFKWVRKSGRRGRRRHY